MSGYAPRPEDYQGRGVWQQEPDGSWVPAKPIRPPLLVRAEIRFRAWRNRRAAQ